MPFDLGLADRLRCLLPSRAGFAEKKMFGGVGFLWHGRMCLGVWKQFLIARIGTARYEHALAQPHVLEFDITGKAMRGWVMIEPEGITRDDELRAWVNAALDFVRTLPRK